MRIKRKIRANHPAISDIIDGITDDFGNGVLGYTIKYSDDTFINVVNKYTKSTREIVLAQITAQRQTQIEIVNSGIYKTSIRSGAEASHRRG